MFDFNEYYYMYKKTLQNGRKYAGNMTSYHHDKIKGPGVIYEEKGFFIENFKIIEEYKNGKPHGLYVRCNYDKKLQEAGVMNEGKYVGPCFTVENKEAFLTSYDSSEQEDGFYVKFIDNGLRCIIFQFRHGQLLDRCLIWDYYDLYKGKCSSLTDYMKLDGKKIKTTFMPQTDIHIFKPETEKMTNVGTTSEYRYYDIYQNGNVVRKYDKKYAYIKSRDDKPIFSLLKTTDYEVFGEYNWAYNCFYGLRCKRYKSGRGYAGYVNQSNINQSLLLEVEPDGIYSLVSKNKENNHGPSFVVYNESLIIVYYENGKLREGSIKIYKDTFDVEIYSSKTELLDSMYYENPLKKSQTQNKEYKRENYPDGAWYEGEFVNGIREGKGTFCWPDGGKYVGGFLNGGFHGEGILYHTDGTSNKVIYNNNEFVSMTANIIRKDYPDGAWYEGEMKNDAWHGQGTFCWPDGGKYVGQFANGVFHGEGILYHANGTSNKVICNNNEFISIAANIIRKDYPDGAWYEGEMKNDTWHGQGTFCWPNGDMYVGGFSHGALHGDGIIYYANGVKEKVVCDNGNYIFRQIIN